MATKNLARTAIEGGRTGYYKTERDTNRRSERHATKQHVKQMVRDPELFDDGEEPSVDEPLSLWKDEIFADKLSPVQRWMKKQVGKSWNGVYSKIRQRFDSRTTAGRHILFDHILRDVSYEGHEHMLGLYGKIKVDSEGVIHNGYERTHGPYRSWVADLPKGMTMTKLTVWLDGRAIGQHAGGKLFWFESTGAKVTVTSDRYGGIHYEPLNPIRLFPWRKYQINFRQSSRLSREDEKLFLSLPELLREKLLSFSPLALKEAA